MVQRDARSARASADHVGGCARSAVQQLSRRTRSSSERRTLGYPTSRRAGEVEPQDRPASGTTERAPRA